ncbi:MAG: TolC family protein [Desulfotalea sp.]
MFNIYVSIKNHRSILGRITKPLSTVILSICLLLPNFVKAKSDMEIAVEATLTRNNQILSELSVIRASGYDLDAAEFDRFPTISIQAELDDEHDNVGYAQLLQPIWVGGRIVNNISKSEIGLERAKQRLLKVQRDLMGETVVNYAEIKGIEARIEAANLNVIEHERLLSLITRREAGQMSSQADIDLANSRLSQAILQQRNLEGLFDQRKNDLFTLTREFVVTQLPISKKYLNIKGDNKQIEDTVVNISSDVVLSRIDIKMAEIESKLSRSEIMPRIYGRLRQDLYREEDRYGNDDLETSLGLVMEMSLDGGGFSNWKRTQSSDENVIASKRRALATEDEIKRRIKSLLTDYHLDQKLIKVNKQLLASTEKTLQSYMRQYDAGRKSWLDLLNIQREHSQARLNLEEIKGEYQKTCLQLNNMQGKLDFLIEDINY